MRYVAIDPGKQGAMCSLDTFEQIILFQDNPDGKKITIPRAHSWLMARVPGAACIGIEDIHSIGGTSAKSNFQFGRNLGHIEALAILNHPDIEYIQPKAWQSLCGLKFVYPKGATATEKKNIRKQTTAARCLELFPGAQIFGPMGGLKDGRADALMIAYALSIKLGDPYYAQ